MVMQDAVIIGYARSPFTFAHKGALARVRPDDMAAAVVAELVRRAGVAPADIEDLICGCAFPEGEQGLNLGRMLVFLAGLPITLGGATVNRFCGSSMQAVHWAAGTIAANGGDLFIAAGVESMSRIPMLGFNPLPHPHLATSYPQAYAAMGATAENVARKCGVSRADQEAFAVLSHAKAAAAQAAGRFADELVAVQEGVQGVAEDGCIRGDTTAEGLAGLKPAFAADGSVTAGTASPLTDGAAAVLVAASDYVKAHGLAPLARIRSFAVAGCAPELMGLGPVAASRKALARAGMTMADIDIIEMNEAFAAQALACLRELGADLDKTNLDGGAIALGHPLGATGARITGKAAALLRREGKQFALVTQCVGGGQGVATVLEAV
jgi:acetyl-CoA acyltransferase